DFVAAHDASYRDVAGNVRLDLGPRAAPALADALLQIARFDLGGANQARGDQVHADPGARDLFGEPDRHRRERAFGCVVVRHPRVGPGRADRAEVDDAAPAVAAHFRE